MGFSKQAVQFLLHCRQAGVSFETCATIGRQSLYLSARELRSAFASGGWKLSADECRWVFQSNHSYAEPLLTLLGAATVDSFDASSFEGATKVVDFNRPLSDRDKAAYTAVIDGGSLEHVFNYPQALKNAMEMVRPGGHLILITPTHSRSGHGFYQLSPELFFRALSEINGYDAPEVLVCSAAGRSWYRVADPATVGGRVAIGRNYSDHLFVMARRCGVESVFEVSPQQSDYAAAWTRSTRAKSNDRIKAYLRANRHRIPRILLRWYSQLGTSPRVGLRRIDLK